MERRPQLGAEALRNSGDGRASGRYRQAGESRWQVSAPHWPRRFDSGRLLRTYDLEREDARGSYDARARVTRRELHIFALAWMRLLHRCSSRRCRLVSPDASASAMRAEGKARVERRVHIADRFCSSRAFVS